MESFGMDKKLDATVFGEFNKMSERVLSTLGLK
jgi:hypothetical protein